MDEQIEQWQYDDLNPENFHKIFEIKKYLKTVGIECKKYNYCLDKEVQLVSTKRANIKLSEDETEFQVFNLKPVKKEHKKEIDIQVELASGKTKSQVGQMIKEEEKDDDNDGKIDEFDFV